MLQIVDFAVTSASLRPFIVAFVTDGVPLGSVPNHSRVEMSFLFSSPSRPSLPECECPAESLIEYQPPCELLWSKRSAQESCPSLMSHGGANVPRTPS